MSIYTRLQAADNKLSPSGWFAQLNKCLRSGNGLDLKQTLSRLKQNTNLDALKAYAQSSTNDSNVQEFKSLIQQVDPNRLGQAGAYHLTQIV